MAIDATQRAGDTTYRGNTIRDPCPVAQTNASCKIARDPPVTWASTRLVSQFNASHRKRTQHAAARWRKLEALLWQYVGFSATEASA
jgi:hypothetical protein